MKLKIGEFARLGQVSVQTLRYYDDLGLLKASEVDCFSGYRYYTLEQLPRLLQILALKDLGVSLEQISHLLVKEMSPAELRNVLQLKQQELREQVQTQLERLERIETRLKLMEQNDTIPSYEVIIKHVAPIRIASVRDKVPTYWDANPLWQRLFSGLQQHQLTPVAPPFTLCHAGEPEIEIEVCAPLPFESGDVQGVKQRLLPEVELMACTVHHGPFTGLITAFTALLTWINANGYTINGPDREIYLRLPEACRFDSDPNAVTELQIPVVKNEV
ncbi:MAG: MerR family transcriptional regulator [Anaerolineae bacterium]|nr:MerR family transcriptional regulator [Anaerolineae bacterium]